MVKPPSLIIPEEEASVLSESGSFQYGSFRIDSKGFSGLSHSDRRLLPAVPPVTQILEEDEVGTPVSSSASNVRSTPLSSSTPLSASSTHSAFSSVSNASTSTRSSVASTSCSAVPSALSTRPLSASCHSSSSTYSASPSTPSPFASFTLSDIQLDSATDARLGRGASGSVHRATHIASNTPLAVKQIPIDLSEAKSKQIVTELRTLHTSECRQVVGFYGAFYRERMMTVVLEYMDVGSLKDFMTRVRDNERRCSTGAGRVTEQLVSLLCHQVLLALRYLHQQKRLIHRDIKPSNILLNSRGDVKLADFGVSGEVEADTQGKMTFVGTLIYMSPERITGAQHGYDSDVWSLGLTMMECLLGRFPYQPTTLDNRRRQAAAVQHQQQAGSGRNGTAALFNGSGVGGGEKTPLSSTSIFTQRSFYLSPTSAPLLSPHTPSPSSASSYLYNATNTTAQTPPKLLLPRPAPTPVSSSFNATLTQTQLQGPGAVDILPSAPQPQMKRESSFCFWGAHECIVKDPPPSLPVEHFSSDCRHFFSLCLQKDSGQRSSASDLLQHPFITRWSKGEEDDRRVLKEWINAEMAASMQARSSSRVRCMQDAQTTAIANEEERKRKSTAWAGTIDANTNQPHTILAQARTPLASTTAWSAVSSAAPSQPASGFSSVTTSNQSSVAATPAYLTPCHASSVTPSTYHSNVTSPSLFSSPIVLPPLPPLTKSTSSVSPDTYLHASTPSPFHSSTPSSSSSASSNSSGRFSPLRIEVPGRKRRRADDCRDNLRVRVGASISDQVRERARELQGKRDKRRRADTPDGGKDAGMDTDNSMPSPETSPLSSTSITSTSSSSSSHASHTLPIRMFGRTVPADLIIPAAPGSPFGQLSIFPPFSPGVVTGGSGTGGGGLSSSRLMSPSFLPLPPPAQPHTAQEVS